MTDLKQITLDFGRNAVHHVNSRFDKNQEHGVTLPENDTIVSAAAVALWQVTQNFPDDWFEKDTIACSSLLPVINDALYLPIAPKSIDAELHTMKIVNKIAWLRQDIWKLWANNQTEELSKKISDDNNDPLTALNNLDKNWVESQVQERVTLHYSTLKENEYSRPYRVTSLRFKPNSQAALLVGGDKVDEFIIALKILGQIGLGGDRTYGYGQFNVTNVSDFTPPILNGKATLTTGLMYPNKDKDFVILDNSSYWQTIWRQGRNTAPGTNLTPITKRVRMVARGAILNQTIVSCMGSSVNVFPDNYKPEEYNGPEPTSKIIYRCGRTITLPINRES